MLRGNAGTLDFFDYELTLNFANSFLSYFWLSEAKFVFCLKFFMCDFFVAGTRFWGIFLLFIWF